MRKFRASIVFRVGVAFVAILLMSLGAMSLYIYWSTVGDMAREFDNHIETEIEGLAEVYRRERLRGLIRTIEARIERDPERSSIYLVTDERRNPVAGNISHWPNALPNGDGWLDFSLNERQTGLSFPARARPFLLRGGVNLLVGRDRRALLQIKSQVEQSLLAGTFIALLLALVVGIALARNTNRRFEEIKRTNRDVTDGHLDRRVPITPRGDDLDDLATSLNAMLDEIQRLLTSIEHITNNIAHDLRTPLARLRNRLREVGDERPQQAEIAACIAEVDRLMNTFNSLLRITKLEAASIAKNGTFVGLRDVVDDAIELYEPLAWEKEISISANLHDKGVMVRGERELLVQAVCNVLDNAIKYSPFGQQIVVDLIVDERGCTLIIADHGIGIPRSDRDRVFERFYRGDRAAAADGLGLGLSLVKAICDFHGADIELSDNRPGLAVSIHFRVVDGAERAAA